MVLVEALKVVICDGIGVLCHTSGACPEARGVSTSLAGEVLGGEFEVEAVDFEIALQLVKGDGGVGKFGGFTAQIVELSEGVVVCASGGFVSVAVGGNGQEVLF